MRRQDRGEKEKDPVWLFDSICKGGVSGHVIHDEEGRDKTRSLRYRLLIDESLSM